ncbi:hypothetical protein TSMEX_002042 [Taenia solium]|eukprot:TsM_000893300 transcript=TsM_000893300 gene=TsM_000893300
MNKTSVPGWQLPNVLTQPEPGAYKQLYIENMLNLRIDGSTRASFLRINAASMMQMVKSELKKIRRRLALDEQRAVESKKRQSEGQKTPREFSQVHFSPQHRQTSDEPRFARSCQQLSAVSKSLKGLPSTKFSNESRMCYKRPFTRTSVGQSANRARIAAVVERLSVPLERQENPAAYQPPILDIVRNVERLHQQKSTKSLTNTSTTITNVPYSQGFVPLSPKAIKALPPPPPYKFEKTEEKPKEMLNLKRENEIFELIKDVPT